MFPPLDNYRAALHVQVERSGLAQPFDEFAHLHARNRYAGQFKAAFAGGQGGQSIEIKLSMHIGDMGLGRQGLIKSISTAHRW